MLALVTGLFTVIVATAQWLSTARDVYEAPETIRGVLGWISRMLATAHPGTILLLLVGIACLAFSGADFWWPRLQSRLSFSSASKAPTAEREKRLGFSAHLIVRIRDVAAIRRKYVFDTGAPEGARIAFYQSASDRFILQATDTRGETYSLEVPIGNQGIPFGEFFYLRVEVGVGNSSTSLSIAVNGKDVQNRALNFPIDLGSRNWSGMVIGADASRQNHGGFDLGELIIYTTTLNTIEAEQMALYFHERWLSPRPTTDATTTTPRAVGPHSPSTNKATK